MGMFQVEVMGLYAYPQAPTVLMVTYKDDEIEKIVDEFGKIWPLSIFADADRERIERALIENLQADRLEEAEYKYPYEYVNRGEFEP